MATKDRHDPFLRRRACADCPFRAEPPKHQTLPGDGLFHGLHPERVQEFAHSILTGNTFHCHKSVNYETDEDGEEYTDTTEGHACAGALATLAREGDLLANFHLRLTARQAEDPEQFVRDFVESLDIEHAPVYDGIEEWVEALTERYEDDGGYW